jgi:adenosylhomocysteine nucleosidase
VEEAVSDRPLLVFAHPAEASAFFAQPGEGSKNVDIIVTGVGKIRAAAALAAHLMVKSPSEIIVVGTAIGLQRRDDPATPVGTVHEIRDVYQHDVVDQHGRSGNHVSLPHTIRVAADGVDISTGDSFLTDLDAVLDLHPTVRLGDMETFAYVWVAKQYGIPVRVFMAVSDYGSNVDWDQTVRFCSERLREAVAAAGVPC